MTTADILPLLPREFHGSKAVFIEFLDSCRVVNDPTL
jgi:hypothetical protein